MRIKITLQGVEKPVVLPLHYNHLLQGIIYNTLSSKIGDKLHNEGFSFNNRKYKLFTFSKILQHGKRKGDYLELDSQITFLVSSPITDIIENIYENISNIGTMKVWNNTMYVRKVTKYKTPELTPPCIVKTLSPITIHTTFFNEDNEKISYYYRPYERQFNNLITKNAINKYNAWAEWAGKTRIDSGTLTLKPIKYNPKFDTKYVYYKKSLIIGSTGVYILDGTPELVWIVYEAGVGDVNSQGFGMIDLYK